MNFSRESVFRFFLQQLQFYYDCCCCRKCSSFLAFIYLRFSLLFFSQCSFYMHQKYETAIKATHDNSRAIIELHEVHMLIVCINIVVVFFFLLLSFVYLFVWFSIQTERVANSKINMTEYNVYVQA